MIAAEHRPHLIALLSALDPVLATLGVDLVPLVVTVSRVRRVMGLAMPSELSAPARAVAIVEAGGSVDEAIRDLDERPRKGFLSYLSGFADAPLAASVAEALATYGVDPSPRLAAVLAIADPARCIALLDRLQRDDNMMDLIPALSAAHLACLDRGLEVPAELERRWGELSRGEPPPGCESHVREAELKLAARRDPIAAIPRLRELVLEIGADYLGSGVAAVVSRALGVDRTAAWALTRDLRWADARGLALEGIARIEPHAAEVEPTLRGLLDEWRTGGTNIDKSPSGAFQLALPLLATCAHARSKDLGRAVIETLGPSPFEILMSTSNETRRANLAAGQWTPELWDAWVATPNDGEAAALPAAAAIPELDDAVLGAWWKLDTLPLRELPWFRPEGDGLP